MRRDYFAKFVFEQKCIPWFIIKEWRVLKKFICVQPFIKTINLERIYRNCLETEGIVVKIMNSKNVEYPDLLLINDVYIKFLEKFKDKTIITDEEIKMSGYYQKACKDIQIFGNFQGRKDESSLILYCRSLLALYKILKKKTSIHSCLKPINEFIDHYKYGYPLVFKISDYNYYMVYEGHHRLSCRYLLGHRFVKAKIIGVIKNLRQISLLSLNDAKGINLEKVLN